MSRMRQRTGNKACLFLSALLLVIWTAGAGTLAAAETIDPQAYGTHDPSIIYADGYFYVFSTGGTLQMRRSRDLVDWDTLGGVLDAIPSWVVAAIQDSEDVVSSLWAPDVFYHNGRYYLNYSASLWGRNTSTIALLSNATLDPADPDYAWVDEGEIISSAGQNVFYNTIDGAFVTDQSGQVWLAFGSFWGGIKLTPLDNTTLKPTTAPPTLVSIAWNPNTQYYPIEAPYIYFHDGYYYLFVNHDFCCDGVNSTYKIKVGRSASVTGPYYDRDGIDMMDGGGTLFAGSGPRWIGPGHASIVSRNGQEYLSFHAYDADTNGNHALRVHYLGWDPDGWPVLGDAVAPVPPEQPQGPTVARWNFEDGTPGTRMNDTPVTGQVGTADLSINGFDLYAWDGTYGPSFSAAGQTPTGTGLSARFDGGQDAYTRDESLNAWSPTAWTIELAVRLDTVSGWQTMLGRDGSAQGEPEADFYFQKNDINDRFRLNFDTVGGQRYVLDADFTVAAGQWYYLAAVCDGAVLKLYADQGDGGGMQVVGTLALNPANDNALAAAGDHWTIGRGWYNGRAVDHITGNLDEIRFSDYAIDPIDQCGAWGYLQNDLNFDCRVDYADLGRFAADWDGTLSRLAEFAEQWLSSTQPYTDGAVYGPLMHP